MACIHTGCCLAHRFRQVPGGSLQVLLDELWQGGIKEEDCLRDYTAQILEVSLGLLCKVIHLNSSGIGRAIPAQSEYSSPGRPFFCGQL